MMRQKGLLLGIVLLLLTACGDNPQKLENGASAPGFDLESLDAGPVRFPDDFQGRLVAIRFWADWCPFCEGEMKALEPVYRKYRDKGVTILAINVRQDRETARRFVNDLDISYTTLLDVQGEVARRYGVIGLPTTFFVDGNGILQTRIIGESTPETFERIIAEIITPTGRGADGH